MSTIWHRRAWPFTVWEGDPNGSASGRGYRTRWRAILAAWWASRYAQQDVWIEHRLPRLAAGRAEAWDEGYAAGSDDVSFEARGLSTDSDAHEHPHENPYRKES